MPSGCLEWQGYLDKDGYGSMQAHGKSERAHRLSWKIFNGEIPNKLYVCHKCDNPRCVSPDHLFLGTQKENVQDSINKQRRTTEASYRYMKSKRKSYPIGQQHPLAKLTDQKVIEILALKVQKKTNQSIAKYFNVSISTIKDIFACKSWKHISREIH